jgi:DNA polymerase-3 subunit gamma/tau
MGEKKAKESQSKQALYRRYRSTSFDEIVGQEHITDLLKAAVASGGISHAYLFTGQKGTGKTSVARILAYAINRLPYDTDTQHLDIIEIDAASNRRIDDIRDLREKVHIAPVSAPYKVYIIDEVHMLTGESFNALLKTLEEPPAHAIFILATTELHKVPATIISRTQRFHFRPVALNKVAAHLANIAKQEAVPVDDDALALIAEYGGGSLRDSIGLLDQVAGLGQQVTTDLVESILGRAGTGAIDDIVHLLTAHDTAGLHAKLTQLLADGVSPITLAEQVTRAVLKDPVLSREWYELADALMDVPKAHFPQLLLTATLLRFSAPFAPKHTDTPMSHETPVTKPATTPTPSAIPRKPQPEQATPEPEQKPTQPTPPTVSAKNEGQEKVSPGGIFDWDAVLAAAKKNNAPLYSILSKAGVEYEGTTLRLRFQYALHRKRLEQPNYRTQVARLIQDVCGLNPEITVESGAKEVAKDETVQKVADIMGGGESVTV